MLILESMRKARREKDAEIAFLQEQIKGIQIFHGRLESVIHETGETYEEILPAGETLKGDTIVIKRGKFRRSVALSEVKLQAVKLGADALVDYHRFACNPKERGIPVRKIPKL